MRAPAKLAAWDDARRSMSVHRRRLPEYSSKCSGVSVVAASTTGCGRVPDRADKNGQPYGAIFDVPGLRELWRETFGDPRICIAVLDGPVDRSHPSLAAAQLRQLSTLVPARATTGAALQHGTHVASVIFGGHDGPVKGIAPGCKGLIVPVFKNGGEGEIAPCSQVDLARAIEQAVQAGATVINISGGELAQPGAAHPLLANAVRNCAENGVLMVAAAGNEGCDCLNVPGALPSVLAVGAMDARGEPISCSNWGQLYREQGMLAPGENILGAKPGGGTIGGCGTSYATAVMSGIVALLLSLQLKSGHECDCRAVRSAILSTTKRCDEQPTTDCRRLLAGRLDLQAAIAAIRKGRKPMPELDPAPATNSTTQDVQTALDMTEPPRVQAAYVRNATAELTPQDGPANGGPPEMEAETPYESPARIQPAACSCGSKAPPQLVYAFGQLGYDFGSEARRDSIMQHMKPPANPNDPVQLLEYLDDNPWDAAAILWTLNLDATPVYAIQAQAGFAAETYGRLREFLAEQIRGEVERVSIPGNITGRARLLTGQVVPIVWPSLRGMYSWNTAALLQGTVGPPPPEDSSESGAFRERLQGLANFLRRVYEELRNLGVTPQSRAINYAASNAFQVAQIFQDAIKEGMELDTIGVERSPICRPESDCWDVKLTFFNPRKLFEQARKVYRFTVDVSDVVPVAVGPVRSWFTR